MLDHIGLTTNDLDASVAFYSKALESLGYSLNSKDKTSAGFGPDQASVFWLYAGENRKGKGTHIAFRAGTREMVDAFYSMGLRAGGRDNGVPGLRADYSPNYYAAFLLDPDGNNVEAVCETKL